MTQLGDELLIAYSDGELSTRQREEIGCVLEHDPVTSLRLKKMQNTRNRFTVLFNDILEDHSRLRVEDIINFPEKVVREALGSSKGQVATTEVINSSTRIQPKTASNLAFPASSAMPVRSQSQSVTAGNARSNNAASERDAHAQEQDILAGKVSKKSAMNVVIKGVSAFGILAAGLVAGYFYQEYLGSNKSNEVVPNLYAPVVNGGWTTAVINHHSLLRRDVIEAAKVNQKNISLIQNQLNSALGMYVSIPNLSNHGLAFARAQILTHNNSKIAQITYLPVQGLPLSLYVKKGEKVSALKNGSLGAVNMVHWAQNKNGFVLAGELPHWKLIVMSVDIKRQFSPKVSRY